jgi:hypothetical protein
MRDFAGIVAGQSLSKVIRAAGVEVRRLTFALQNVNVSKIAHLPASLPSRSSQ